ncbi:AraC family transcriptional regulator [Chitinophaga silvatica]|nr:AraC family transcriptional regulator [Chitinophaga silvatica]
MKDLVLNIIAYAAQRDVDVSQLCKLSGINPGSLKNLTPTHTQLQHLWANAVHLTNDSLFGLHLGESLRATALGIVGNLVQSSATVGEALTHAAALVHLITNQCSMKIDQGKGTFKVHLLPAANPENHTAFGNHQLTELLMVIVIHELDGLMLKKIVPKSVLLPYRVIDPAEYERVFRCKPGKSVDEFSITFHQQYWNEPILTANHELQELLLKKISSLPSPKSTSSTFQTRIFNHLIANSYLGLSSLNDIAANFNMSPRTLQRKLKEEGASYQLIAEEAKRSLAEHYVSSGSFALKDISWMLGYNDLSAFSRAFKRWTGKAPVDYGA